LLPAELPGLAALYTPLGLALALLWNFAVLACLQLTVRLIRTFSVRATLIAAVVQTAVFLMLAATYVLWLGARLDLFIIPAALMGATGYALARWVLHIRRVRSHVVAAIGTALLASPWPVFLLTPPR
jgi:hypothetical protein